MASISLPNLPSPVSPHGGGASGASSSASASASTSTSSTASTASSASLSPPKQSTMHAHAHVFSSSPHTHTHTHARDRSLSRPSSRGSVRSGRASPGPGSYTDEQVALRTHMSTLKHSIRHQQAQLQSLEAQLLRGPRPLPPDIDFIMSPPGPSSYSPVSAPASATSTNSTSTVMKRRSSFDVLLGIAGSDSGLPLPSLRTNGVNGGLGGEDGIREGVPMSFGASNGNTMQHKRAPSPTRTLSRIPVSSVGNARALADDGNSRGGSSSSLREDSTVLVPPPSPGRRASFTPGGTTKVLADLQTGVINARTALENTKAQLRLSQRSVAQLTRQTEDLKEGRERLRLENEGLNNVVARKERLLQEVLDRARKAEAEAAQLRAQLKSETSTSKRALREMEATVAEATAVSQKSEREYVTLRESIRGLVEGFKADSERLREEVRRREERWRAEAESVGAKYRVLVEEVRKGEEMREKVRELREVERVRGAEVEREWTEEIQRMKGKIEASSEAEEEARITARELAGELGRLRRLMQRNVID